MVHVLLQWMSSYFSQCRCWELVSVQFVKLDASTVPIWYWRFGELLEFSAHAGCLKKLCSNIKKGMWQSMVTAAAKGNNNSLPKHEGNEGESIFFPLDPLLCGCHWKVPPIFAVGFLSSNDLNKGIITDEPGSLFLNWFQILCRLTPQMETTPAIDL